MQKYTKYEPIANFIDIVANLFINAPFILLHTQIWCIKTRLINLNVFM